MNMITVYLDSSIQQVVSTPKSLLGKNNLSLSVPKTISSGLGNLLRYFALNV